MLHVLEHLDRPGQALRETVRILRPGGWFMIEVPFIYPVHDAPLDFRRWTQNGLTVELQQAGLRIEKVTSAGRATETAAVLFNLAIARMSIDWLQRRSPWLLLGPFLWLLIPLSNILGWALGPLQRETDFMPHRVRALCRKPE
jgi:SAM-dependent methyltransferase